MYIVEQDQGDECTVSGLNVKVIKSKAVNTAGV